jgi:hypothetical protein
MWFGKCKKCSGQEKTAASPQNSELNYSFTFHSLEQGCVICSQGADSRSAGQEIPRHL